MDETTEQEESMAKQETRDTDLAGKTYAWLLVLYAVAIAIMVVEYLASHADI